MCSSSPGTELCSTGIIPLKAAPFLVKCLSPCKRWRGGELSTRLSRPNISSGSSGANAWSISQKRQRTPAGLSFAIEPGMMDVPRPHASLLRAARIVRDFSREMTSPACRSAMPRATPPEMESSGACAACSFMPSAEGMKGILRLRMTARAKMAKASEGDRPILRHVSVNSLSRSSSLSTDMAVRNPISGRCIYRTCLSLGAAGRKNCCANHTSNEELSCSEQCRSALSSWGARKRKPKRFNIRFYASS